MQCSERLSGSLSKLDESVQVGEISKDSKKFSVTYDPAKVTLHQLTQAVAITEPVHPPKRYEAALIVTVEDLAKNTARVKRGLGQVKGVLDFMPLPGATEPGEIMIVLRPLLPQAKPSDQVKASQIAEALEKAGIKFSGLPASSESGGPDDTDSKKKAPAGRGASKSKLGGDADSPFDKSKPARSVGGATRTRPPRDPASSAAKSKDGPAEEVPRFQILAVAGEKVYLIDHQTKTEDGKELKKFVKQGDTFGNFVVKEMADKDGWYVILEDADTKEKIRVEQESKSKDDSKAEKGKESKEKDAGDTRRSPDAPRFQILAVVGDRVYLADHEAKLKKFVKVGDKFGEFVVKEMARDGWVIVLEKEESKETIRIEEKKEKSSPRDSGASGSKEEKEKDSKQKPSSDKEKKEEKEEKKDKDEN